MRNIMCAFIDVTVCAYAGVGANSPTPEITVNIADIEPLPTQVARIVNTWGIDKDIAYIIYAEAVEHGVPYKLLCSLIYYESRFVINAKKGWKYQSRQ